MGSVVLFSEVTNALSLWEVEITTCPLFRGCPFFRVSTVGGSTVYQVLELNSFHTHTLLEHGTRHIIQSGNSYYTYH